MKLKVYQIDSNIDTHSLHFASYDSTLNHEHRIDPSIYKCVFDGKMECKDLEDVFVALNTEHPVGYNGYSLLYYFYDYTYEQIAQLDRCTKMPVKRSIDDAIKKLRKLLI